MWTKLFGWGFIALGIATIFLGPYTSIHQNPMMTNAIVFLGIIFLGIGVFLLRM